jgi:hypothetical protein
MKRTLAIGIIVAVVAGGTVALLTTRGARSHASAAHAPSTQAASGHYPDVRGMALAGGFESAFRRLTRAGYCVEANDQLPWNWDQFATVSDAPYIKGQYPDPSSGVVPPRGTTVELVLDPGLVSGTWAPPPKQCP